MNKIVIENDIIKEYSLDQFIQIELLEKNELFNVNSLTIKVIGNTSLELIHNCLEETKLDVFVNVMENVDFTLFENRTGVKTKSQYKYYIYDDAHITVNKINDVSQVKELSIINLNGKNSSINYILKTISTNTQKYDMVIYHNESKVTSNITNNGINTLDGKLTFNVSGFVAKNKIECVVNQNNRIINLNQHECIINPNLYIDEYDVSANHSAFIGNFNDDEMFYLQSRGLDKSSAYQLLIKGFLNSNLEKNEFNEKTVNNIINKYWG